MSQAGGTKPEEAVRQMVIGQLRALGWHEAQLRWKPEWPVPDTPHDLTKRERGQKYATCGSADLVAFADNSGEWFALSVIFEFKAPSISEGRSQLLRYLSNEPMAKMGYWTNGRQSLAVYKRHGSDWVFVDNAALPNPTDDLTQPPVAPPTWETLRVPSEVELAGALKRLVVTAVVSDPNVTRREDQLRELIHILLVKLDSDAVASRSANVNKPVSFRIYGDVSRKVEITAEKIRDLFKEYFTKQQTRIFNPADRDQLFFSDETIFAVAAELSPLRILGDNVDLLSALKKAIGLCARRFRHCAEAQISPYRAQIRADLMAATASFRP
ncbi:hypothetical protein, partial [Rhodoblastus sp.]|uniref:hypothetical protein n=1 Tax=Rhodoblastus sp. TaxID=1962975 RepID=UPI003F9B02B3